MDPSIVGVIVLTIYCLPVLIAVDRKLKNWLSILVLTIFLGWTLIGWAVALMWAVSGTAQKRDRVEA